MKKLSAVLFMAGALLLLSCAGCAKHDDVFRVATYTSDPAIIKILQDNIRDIESRHPGLKIELMNIPYNSYEDKLMVMIAGHNAPDVISVEVNNFVDLYTRDALEDLTPYFQRDGMDPKQYYPAIINRFSPGGKVYALPGDISPFGLVYYNKKIFDAAGVPYPKASWSWPKDFLAVCQKLVKKDDKGKITQWAFADPYGFTADNFMLSNGGYFTDSQDNPTRMTLDTPEVLEAYRFRWDLIWTYHVSPTLSEMQDTNFGNGAENMFINGQLAMMDSGIWHTPNFLLKGLDFDVVEFPKGPTGKRGWGCGGSGYAVSKDCKDKEKAWMVVQELAGEATATKLVTTGLIQPALIKLAHSDVFLKSPGPANKKILLDMTKDAHFAPFLKNWPEIWYGQVGPAMDPVWLGTKKPEDVLPGLTKDLNKKYFNIK